MQSSCRMHAPEPVLTLLPAVVPGPAAVCCAALPEGTACAVLAPGTGHGSGISTVPAAQQHTTHRTLAQAPGCTFQAVHDVRKLGVCFAEKLYAMQTLSNIRG